MNISIAIAYLAIAGLVQILVSEYKITSRKVVEGVKNSLNK